MQHFFLSWIGKKIEILTRQGGDSVFRNQNILSKKKLGTQFSGRAIKAMNLHRTFNKINVCWQFEHFLFCIIMGIGKTWCSRQLHRKNSKKQGWTNISPSKHLLFRKTIFFLFNVLLLWISISEVIPKQGGTWQEAKAQHDSSQMYLLAFRFFCFFAWFQLKINHAVFN